MQLAENFRTLTSTIAHRVREPGPAALVAPKKWIASLPWMPCCWALAGVRRNSHDRLVSVFCWGSHLLDQKHQTGFVTCLGFKSGLWPLFFFCFCVFQKTALLLMLNDFATGFSLGAWRVEGSQIFSGSAWHFRLTFTVFHPVKPQISWRRNPWCIIQFYRHCFSTLVFCFFFSSGFFSLKKLFKKRISEIWHESQKLNDSPIVGLLGDFLEELRFRWTSSYPLKANMSIPKIAMFERKYLFQTIIFGIYVRFQVFCSHFLKATYWNFQLFHRGSGG